MFIRTKKNNYWFGSNGEGVYRYDGKTLTQYAVYEGSKEIHLVSMYKDNKGDLWLGTPENGVFKFNGNSFEKFNP